MMTKLDPTNNTNLTFNRCGDVLTSMWKLRQHLAQHQVTVRDQLNIIAEFYRKKWRNKQLIAFLIK